MTASGVFCLRPLESWPERWWSTYEQLRYALDEGADRREIVDFDTGAAKPTLLSQELHDLNNQHLWEQQQGRAVSRMNELCALTWKRSVISTVVLQVIVVLQ